MRYLKPENREEALRMLSEHPDFLLLCGSTDMALRLKREKGVKGLIDIGGLHTLKEIGMEAEHVHIGALVTVSDMLENKALCHRLPLLEAAAKRFASRQIRNLATLGGNIANASPASDLSAVLLALDARVTLDSLNGERSLALEDLFCGYKCTKLAEEMIVGIDIPLCEHQWYYRKSGARERLNIAKVSMAVVKKSDGYAVSGASLNPYAVRFGQVEALLDSGNFNDEMLRKALEEDISPSGSFRSTKSYRMRVAFNMLKEALSKMKP